MINIIACTSRGGELAGKLCSSLNAIGYESTAYIFSKYAQGTDLSPAESLKSWCEKTWNTSDGIVFVCATGIAVRTIAPFIKSKKTDPAVVVIDEMGQYSISLLSGHMGGANDLAVLISEISGAKAIITTATDISGLFAVDVFAEKNGLEIMSMELAKEVSASVLRGECVGLFSKYKISGKIPEYITLGKKQNINICIGYGTDMENTLLLIPRDICVGIGCKRGTSSEKISALVLSEMSAAGIPFEAISSVSSIDIKKDEPGLIEFCMRHHFPFDVFTANELMSVPGVFSSSDYVKSKTGVDCVCERAAVLAAGGKLVVSKTAADGVTFAAAAREMRIEI